MHNESKFQIKFLKGFQVSVSLMSKTYIEK